MTVIEVPRGELRAALSAVLPSAGRESEQTPELGRVRLHPSPEALLVWATDNLTTALARIEHPEYFSEVLDTWDMPASAVKKVLQVFMAPSNPDSREMWNDQMMRVEVGEHQVTVTEAGSLVDGQSLTVPRVVTTGEDRYPDVPRVLTALGDRTLEEPGASVRVNMVALARFASAAKAYSDVLPIVQLVPSHGSGLLLVRIGEAFVGSVPAYPTADERGDTLAARAVVIREQTGWWSELLTPLHRPTTIRVDQATVDDLTRQAAVALADAGDAVKLHVVRGEDS